jgi:hypothetical protein
MNAKRMRFSFLVLTVYAVLGIVGIYSETTGSNSAVRATDVTAIVISTDARQTSAEGAIDASIEWHSFLPGSFK